MLRRHFKFFDKHTLTGYRTPASEEGVQKMMTEIEEWAVKDKMLSIVGKELGERGKEKVRMWQEKEILQIHPLL